MRELPSSRRDAATIFERHAEVWRVLAVFLPAALAGTLASDIVEQRGVTGAPRLAVGIAVTAVLVLVFLRLWLRVLAWLAARNGSRPTV